MKLLIVLLLLLFPCVGKLLAQLQDSDCNLLKQSIFFTKSNSIAQRISCISRANDYAGLLDKQRNGFGYMAGTVIAATKFSWYDPKNKSCKLAELCFRPTSHKVNNERIPGTRYIAARLRIPIDANR